MGTSPDVFLAHRRALPEPISEYASLKFPLGAERDFLDYLDKINESPEANSELKRFAAANYVKESIGWRTRFRFAFTLEELRGLLLRLDARDAAGDDGIALVLTGGGVKAAYQTKLIDHLYGEGFLHNRFAAEPRDPRSVAVKYVVGTSGGALLGIFVSSLKGAKSQPELSTKLWYIDRDKPTRRLLSSGDVFPKVDMMRWLSLLACMVIFGLVCFGLSHVLRLLHRGPPDGPRDGTGRLWRLSFWWLLLLGVTPWLLIHVNGKHGQEHIPAVQGLFYFVYVLIAIHSDNRFITTGEPRAVTKPGWPPLCVGAAGVGLIAIAVALRVSQSDTKPLAILQDFEITLPALLACIGVLVVSCGVHWWLLRRARWLQPVETRTVSAFALLIGVCVLSYLPIIFQQAPSFELTLDFWKYLALSALVVSLVLAALSYWGQPRFLKDFFDFLLSRHPAQASGTGRHSRIILGFVAGWLWWNLAVAPGAYGNGNARHYFKEAAKNVFDKKVDGESLRDVQFNAFYVAPITALRDGLERYVMFQPRQADQPGVPGAQRAGQRNWASISSDPRWFLVESDEQQAELVLRVAFASGSPFPVFPPHRIRLGSSESDERLFVDGGYAHNVPVEAAKRLGARRVLVISSSPRSNGAAQTGRDSKFQPLGDFAWMVRWIVPYLYERSQAEDALSAEDLLVASIAPSASEDGWPFLTDFRDVVIERMFREAEDDKKRRVGKIEHWRPPSFGRPAGS